MTRTRTTMRRATGVKVPLYVLTLVATLSRCSAAPSCTSHLLAGETVSRCYEYSIIPSTQELLNETTILFIDSQNLTVLPSLAHSQPETKAQPDPGLARLKRLKLLDLSSNQIIAVYPEAFSANSELLNLSLDNNLLIQVPQAVFRSIPQLRSLNLARNAIRTIGNDSFANLTRLVCLNLTSNHIQRVENGAFDSLRSLRELYLSDNQLTTLNEDIGLPLSLSLFHLGRNRFHCDCALLWLKMRFAPTDLRTNVQYDKDDLMCSTATVPEAAGQKWTHLRFSQFACAPVLHEPPAGSVKVTSVQIGSTAILTCRIYSHPKTEIFWKRAGNDLGIVDEKYSVSHSVSYNFSATLSIHNAVPSDSGIYTCVTKNDAGTVHGNFSLMVSHSAGDEMELGDGLQGLGYVEEDGKTGLINNLTVIGASVCAFIVIITIISTIIYCLNVAKSVRRRKTRRVLPTKQYAKAPNGVLSTVSGQGHGHGGDGIMPAMRSPLQVRGGEHYEAAEEPVYSSSVENSEQQGVVGYTHARTRSQTHRQVTFADTCPVYGSNSSVAVVQPLMSGSASSGSVTENGEKASPNAGENGGSCPLHGLSVGMFHTLPGRSQFRFDSAPNGVSNGHVTFSPLGKSRTMQMSMPMAEADPASTRQHYLTLQPASSIMSPTRAIADSYGLELSVDSPNTNMNANAAAIDSNSSTVANANANANANGNGNGNGHGNGSGNGNGRCLGRLNAATGFRVYEDEGYNTAV